jgi:hypothetical protein
VQVDPIKPTLKLPGTKRLKLKCDAPLSNFAFNINLRCYIMEAQPEYRDPAVTDPAALDMVEWCRLTLSNPR